MKTILMVEDNQTDELLAIRALKKSGVDDEIVVVRDGQEAVDFLFGLGAYKDRDLSAVPSIILLDLKLPKLSGFEVLQKIRANPKTQNLPVIMVTSSCEEQDIRKAQELNSNGYIQKPITHPEFMKAYEQLGKFYISLDENCSKENCGRLTFSIKN